MPGLWWLLSGLLLHPAWVHAGCGDPYAVRTGVITYTCSRNLSQTTFPQDSFRSGTAYM